MAANIDMFGVGGEGLGGLFMGNQMAMQRDADEVARQKTLADIANTQEIQRQRRLGNDYEEAIMPDKISAYRDAAEQKKQDIELEKFNRQGEQFGRLGQTLSSIPAAARPAALRQMAASAGIGDDNPMLKMMMGMDPEQIPDAMMKFSEGFYEQGDKARAEKQRRDAMYKQAEMQAKERAAQAAEANDTKLMIARMAAESRRDAASIAAAARGGSGGGGSDKPLKETYDNFLTRTAREQVAAGNWTLEQANDYVQRAKLAQGAVRVPDTAPQVMSGGTPTTAQQRVDQAVQQSMPQRQAPAPAVGAKPKFEEGKIYQDAKGNKAKYVNGQWVPVDAAPASVPK